ncbi:MAG: PIG-L deacetylase family protein [Gammaproteobacteria bacterium]
MVEQLKLMCVLAHPDDESLGTGGTLAKYAAEGIETYLVTATRGERGWTGNEQDNPGLEALGKTREAELLAAARVLGLREVKFLDYVDGDLDQSDSLQIVARIVGHLRRVKPQVVITFGPDGVTGHPDHIAVSQFTTARLWLRWIQLSPTRISRISHRRIGCPSCITCRKPKLTLRPIEPCSVTTSASLWMV